MYIALSLPITLYMTFCLTVFVIVIARGKNVHLRRLGVGPEEEIRQSRIHEACWTKALTSH